MASKIDFKTLMMKLVNIFPKDMYLVHNWCAIAGEDSDVENRGNYLCIFEPDVRELLNKLFPNNPTIYIKSIRDAKTDISKLQEILDIRTIKTIDSTVNELMSSFNSLTTWDTFNFSESEISSLFDEAQSLLLFEDDVNKPSIIISKSIFPLITEKTINDVKYSYSKDIDDINLNQIIMSYEYDLFQLVMNYRYINI